jgi:hypothetical protein
MKSINDQRHNRTRPLQWRFGYATVRRFMERLQAPEGVRSTCHYEEKRCWSEGLLQRS